MPFTMDILGVKKSNSDLLTRTYSRDINWTEEQDQEKLRDIAVKRNISEIYHFTTARNLSGIIKEKAIFPRDTCKHLIRLGADIEFPDSLRLDGRTDCTSVSLSWVNYKMLDSKRDDQNSGDWILLRLSIDVLYYLSGFYCPTNAAHKTMKTIISKYNLEHLFVDPLRTEKGKNSSRYDIGIDDKFTSDPQAEILVNSPIPISMVEKYIFKPEMSPKARQLHAALKIRDEFKEKIVVDDRPFMPRNDFHFWKDDSLSIPL